MCNLLISWLCHLVLVVLVIVYVEVDPVFIDENIILGFISDYVNETVHKDARRFLILGNCNEEDCFRMDAWVLWLHSCENSGAGEQ